MTDTEVILPGGLSMNGRIECQAIFRPLTGRIEQTLMGVDARMDRPGYVTTVLAAAVERIGNHCVDEHLAETLCVADRQYLMLRLAAMLFGEQMWLNVDCVHCGITFDVEARRCDLPVKMAGEGFPSVRLDLDAGITDIRVPRGRDQNGLAECDEMEAVQQLLLNCILTVKGEPPGMAVIRNLSDPDVEMIDKALDEASPAVCNRLIVNCPECGRQQHAGLDHYALTDIKGFTLYDEVHTLASHYHWSEAEILDLLQTKRRIYLAMINRSAGSSVQEGLA